MKNWKNRPSNLILLFFHISWSFYLYLEGGCSSYLQKEEFKIRCFFYPFIHIRVTTRFRIENSCLFRNLFPWSHSCKCMCSRRHFHQGNIRYFCMAIVCTKVLYYLRFLCLLSLNPKKMRLFFSYFFHNYLQRILSYTSKRSCPSCHLYTRHCSHTAVTKCTAML